MAGKEVTENRDKYIGGSDIPIIMGLSPFKTRYQLLLEKAHLKDVEEVSNPAIDYGNTMEPIIRDYLNKHYAPAKAEIMVENKDIDPDTSFYDEFFSMYRSVDPVVWKPYTYMQKNPDEVADDELATRVNADGYNGDSVIEIKTTSQIHDSLNGYKHYLVQLMYEMYMLDARYGLLAVYHRPENYSTEFDESRLQVFEVDYEEYVTEIESTVTASFQFQDDFKKIKANPFMTEEDLLPVEVVEIAKKVIALEEKLAEYKYLDIERKALLDTLYNVMNDHGIKKWETPNGSKITLVEPTTYIKEELDQESLKAYHPGLYKSFVKETNKSRKGYVKVTL